MLINGSCCGGGEYNTDDVNGTCPYCGGDTIDGIAAEICSYSPIECEHCGSQPCQLFC